MREARRRAHLSQRSLAAIAGVPQSTVARIEGGHVQPSLPLLYRILGAAGVKPRTVLESADEVSVASEAVSAPPAYRPMTMVDLAGHLTKAHDDQLRWRLVAEFLEEHRHEPIEARQPGLRRAVSKSSGSRSTLRRRESTHSCMRPRASVVEASSLHRKS